MSEFEVEGSVAPGVAMARDPASGRRRVFLEGQAKAPWGYAAEQLHDGDRVVMDADGAVRRVGQ